MSTDVTAEVQRVHLLLARWLGTEADDEVLDALRAAHADDFSMVTTDGMVLDVDQLFASLASARNAVPGLNIEIDEVAIVAELPEMLVATFLETHHGTGEPSRRRTTAVLLRTTTGLRWRHLHETVTH